MLDRTPTPREISLPLNYIYKFIKQNKMSNNVKDSSIDVSFLCISLKSIGEQLDAEEFTEILDNIVGAKEKGKLNEYLDLAYQMVEEGTDLLSSFNYAHYDMLVEAGDKI